MKVLVTGAAGAIGAACVRRFLAESHTVIAHDVDCTRWASTPSVVPISGDLRAADCLERIAAVVGTHGLAAVVAAHGVPGAAALADCTPDFVARVLAVNFTTIPALFTTVRDGLRRNHGSFVAVASQAGLLGEADNAAYCAAKFAVVGWVEAMARLSPDIDLHALCPGATNSPLLTAAQRDFAAAQGVTQQTYSEQRARQIAVGRYGEPDEIAAAAAYLARPALHKPIVLPVTGGDVMR